jgi:hypothetical protein
VAAALFTQQRVKYHQALISSGALSVGEQGVLSIADKGNKASVLFSKKMVERIGSVRKIKKLPGQEAGHAFEAATREFVEQAFGLLSHLRPGNWSVTGAGKKENAIALFDQYAHLDELEKAIAQFKELRSMLGNDYLVAPDIIVSREPEADEVINRNKNLVDSKVANFSPLRRRKKDQRPIMHASISCKFTLRSDRAQNARTEALNMIRNRKGRTPHIVVVTAEPTPSRLASLALGTGDLDCIYHFALDELRQAVNESKYDDAKDALESLISGKRLRDISDLPLDLAV